MTSSCAPRAAVRRARLPRHVDGRHRRGDGRAEGLALLADGVEAGAPRRRDARGRGGIPRRARRGAGGRGRRSSGSALALRGHLRVVAGPARRGDGVHPRVALPRGRRSATSSSPSAAGTRSAGARCSARASSAASCAPTSTPRPATLLVLSAANWAYTWLQPGRRHGRARRPLHRAPRRRHARLRHARRSPTLAPAWLLDTPAPWRACGVHRPSRRGGTTRGADRWSRGSAEATPADAGVHTPRRGHQEAQLHHTPWLRRVHARGRGQPRAAAASRADELRGARVPRAPAARLVHRRRDGAPRRAAAPAHLRRALEPRREGPRLDPARSCRQVRRPRRPTGARAPRRPAPPAARRARARRRRP